MRKTYEKPRAEIEERLFGLPLVRAWPVREPRPKNGEVGIKNDSHDSAVHSVFVRVRLGEGSAVIVGKVQRELVKGPNDEDIFECGVLITTSIDNLAGLPECGGESRFPGGVIAVENNSIDWLRHGEQ